MSFTATANFDSAPEYDLENTELDAGAGKLSIVPNPGQLFEQPFTSDAGFTYDNTKAEFTGGLVRQKDLRPLNAVLAATYDLAKDLSWINSGSGTHTNKGTTALVGGKLQALGVADNGVSYTSTEIGSVGNTGALKFKFTPNYSGTPSTNLTLFENRAPSGSNDRIVLFHGATGVIRLTMYSSVGSVIHSAANLGGVWNPVAGTEYEIEFNWDTIAGLIRVFINGVLQGNTPVQSFARGTTATVLEIGAGATYAFSDGSYNDVVMFSEVQHSAGYTAGYSLPEYIYAANNVDLPTFSYTGIGTIIAVEASTVTVVGSPRFTVAGLYWNGSAWVASNGTYAQANDAATVIANLTSLNVTGATSVAVKVLFQNANTLSSVDLVSVTVTGQKYSPTGTIEPLLSLQVQAIQDIETDEEIPADTEIKYAIRVDGVLKYFDSTNWVNSNGTEAQTNTLTEINNNVGSLEFGVNSTVKIFILLITDDPTETPEIGSLTIHYDFGGVVVKPAKCLVYGYVKDISDAPIANANLTFELIRGKKEYKEANANVILGPKKIVQSDVNGYFELDLIRSSEFEGESQYQVSMEKSDVEASLIGTAKLLFDVPDAETKNLTDLLTAI